MDKLVSRKYFNEHAGRWDSSIRNDHPEKLRALINGLGIPENARILDVGTGTGGILAYLKEIVVKGSQVTSIDFAFNMLSIARTKHEGREIRFICAEIEQPPFPTNSFDAVTCYSTFPHFHDKLLAIRNIHALLKPDGRLFIFHSASRESINHIHQAIPDLSDHLLPDQSEMNALLARSGFSHIEIIEQPDLYLAFAAK